MPVDVALVGGGLANALIAWRLLDRRPDTTILIVERDTAIGGNHTWSFHGTDLEPETLRWLRPLVSASWAGYQVAFPGLRRTFRGEYHSIRSEDLRSRLAARMGGRIRLGVAATEVTDARVTLADGEVIDAGVVLDGRGFRAGGATRYGYQRFVGLDVELDAPHGLTQPVIMDATVPQEGGYRFFYLLPWSPTRVLIEDTVYSDTADHDVPGSRRAIEGYTSKRGWRIAAICREETGALPIPLGAASPRVDSSGTAIEVGVAAGLFHPTTGYSLPYAAATAELIAELPRLDALSVSVAVRRYADAAARRHRFFHLLNRMLFLAARPSERYRVLERFHRLPDATIERFYADCLTGWDRIRLLAGRPPVSVRKAIGCLWEPR